MQQVPPIHIKKFYIQINNQIQEVLTLSAASHRLASSSSLTSFSCPPWRTGLVSLFTQTLTFVLFHFHPGHSGLSHPTSHPASCDCSQLVFLPPGCSKSHAKLILPKYSSDHIQAYLPLDANYSPVKIYYSPSPKDMLPLPLDLYTLHFLPGE